MLLLDNVCGSGSQYIGEWSNGKINGYGKLLYVDGAFGWLYALDGRPWLVVLALVLVHVLVLVHALIDDHV